jgi:hypothetical protein
MVTLSTPSYQGMPFQVRYVFDVKLRLFLVFVFNLIQSVVILVSHQIKWRSNWMYSTLPSHKTKRKLILQFPNITLHKLKMNFNKRSSEVEFSKIIFEVPNLQN